MSQGGASYTWHWYVTCCSVALMWTERACSVTHRAHLIAQGPRSTITHEELGEMKYLTAAIKEALRLYPPVPFISRELDEDIEVQGYRIPAGTSRVCVCGVRCVRRSPLLCTGTAVSIAPLGIHYNASVWPQPHLYQPERYEDFEVLTLTAASGSSVKQRTETAIRTFPFRPVRASTPQPDRYLSI